VLETEKIKLKLKLALFSQSQLCLGAPDCPVVHRTVSSAPGWLWRTGRSRDFDGGVRLTITGLSGGAPDCPVSQQSAEESARDAWQAPTVGWGTGLPGVHRTVSGAPTAPKCQRSASPNKEEDLHRTVSGGAPDCPVRQATEGKNCLPGMHSTAPSRLGAIKGTPRRMEEYTKHSLSIPKHQDFDSAHLILCDSNWSFI
jgi:hypothetical protein